MSIANRTLIILSVLFFLLSCSSDKGIREVSDSNYNVFERFGVRFEYPKNYKVVVQSKRKYSNIFLRDRGSHISVQIMNHTFDKDFKKIYLKTLIAKMFNLSFLGSHATELNKNISLLYRGQRISVPSSMHKTYFKNTKDSYEIVMLSYFFSFEGKGYIVNFVVNSKAKAQDDFDVVSRTFAIL